MLAACCAAGMLEPLDEGTAPPGVRRGAPLLPPRGAPQPYAPATPLVPAEQPPVHADPPAPPAEPSPPHSPPSPPTAPPPLSPGGTYQPIVTIAFTLSGSVSSFDSDAQDAFRENLATQLNGVSASDIELTITAASVQVSARISARNASTAQTAAATISSTPTDQLSAALGQTIEDVSPPVVASVFVAAPSPPPPSPPLSASPRPAPPPVASLFPPLPASPPMQPLFLESTDTDALSSDEDASVVAASEDAPIAVVVAVCSAVLVVVLLLLLAACWYCVWQYVGIAIGNGNSQRRRPLKQQPTATDAVAVAIHQEADEEVASIASASLACANVALDCDAEAEASAERSSRNEPPLSDAQAVDNEPQLRDSPSCSEGSSTVAEGTSKSNDVAEPAVVANNWLQGAELEKMDSCDSEGQGKISPAPSVGGAELERASTQSISPKDQEDDQDQELRT